MMYGEQLVIPTVLTKKMLKDYYTGHPGMSRKKGLMWSYVYWPGMDKYMVKSCKSCISVTKTPPMKWNPCPKTDKLWSRLYIYYAGPTKTILFCQSWQLYEMARSFQMQIANDKNHNKGITGTVCKIQIARNCCIWQWHTIYIKRIWKYL